jgi:hypothetical protein
MISFRTTWESLGVDVPDFHQWMIDKESKFSSQSTAKLAYLSSLYQQRKDFVSPSLIGDTCPFAMEVRLACDQLSITGDSTYADRLIRGERLNPNLHPDYIAKTKCHG